MPTFHLTIRTDAAAFHDEHTGEPDPLPEVARLLRIAAQLDRTQRRHRATARSLRRGASEYRRNPNPDHVPDVDRSTWRADALDRRADDLYDRADHNSHAAQALTR